MAEGLNSTGIQLGAPGIATGIAYIQLHSDTPNSSGSNECACDREAVTCTSASGVVTIPETDFTGGTANGAVKAVGYWSAATGGTFYGYNLIPSDDDQSFNASGAYTVNESTITGSSS